MEIQTRSAPFSFPQEVSTPKEWIPEVVRTKYIDIVEEMDATYDAPMNAVITRSLNTDPFFACNEEKKLRQKDQPDPSDQKMQLVFETFKATVRKNQIQFLSLEESSPPCATPASCKNECGTGEFAIVGKCSAQVCCGTTDPNYDNLEQEKSIFVSDVSVQLLWSALRWRLEMSLEELDPAKVLPSNPNELNPFWSALLHRAEKDGKTGLEVERDKAAFWSGGIASSIYARSKDFKTLESTRIGASLDYFDEVWGRCTKAIPVPWAAVGMLWNLMSLQFANYVEGKVVVFLRAIDHNAVWARQEFKQVEARRESGEVTGLTANILVGNINTKPTVEGIKSMAIGTIGEVAVGVGNEAWTRERSDIVLKTVRSLLTTKQTLPRESSGASYDIPPSWGEEYMQTISDSAVWDAKRIETNNKIVEDWSDASKTPREVLLSYAELAIMYQDLFSVCCAITPTCDTDLQNWNNLRHVLFTRCKDETDVKFQEFSNAFLDGPANVLSVKKGKLEERFNKDRQGDRVTVEALCENFMNDRFAMTNAGNADGKAALVHPASDYCPSEREDAALCGTKMDEKECNKGVARLARKRYPIGLCLCEGTGGPSSGEVSFTFSNAEGVSIVATFGKDMEYNDVCTDPCKYVEVLSVKKDDEDIDTGDLGIQTVEDILKTLSFGAPPNDMFSHIEKSDDNRYDITSSVKATPPLESSEKVYVFKHHDCVWTGASGGQCKRCLDKEAPAV